MGGYDKRFCVQISQEIKEITIVLRVVLNIENEWVQNFNKQKCYKLCGLNESLNGVTTFEIFRIWFILKGYSIIRLNI